MTESDAPAPVEPYVATVAGAVVAMCQKHGLALPHLVLEPGRSLIAQAGVAIYRVGARKEIPGVRTYVSVDGGMADNIRPALYGAKYSALSIKVPLSPNTQYAIRNPQSSIPNPQSRSSPPPTELVTIAGRFCESGDVLIRDIKLPRLQPGDLLAIPMAGAYTLSMASNYNLVPRPAVVLVADGRARLIQRRETHRDLLVRDEPLHETPRPAQVRCFHKYQALGNDYIVLDPADWPEQPSAALVRHVCDRHRGVGADGLLWGPLGTAWTALQGRPGEPFGLRLFNPDGGEFEKSGNGLRIFARYLWDRRLAPGPSFTLMTPVGPVTAHVLDPSGGRIAMDMGRLSFDSREVPVIGLPREVVDERVSVAGRELWITAVTIGNPHCVLFLDRRNAAALGELVEPSAQLAHELGPMLEHSPLFPSRTNVQFAQVMDSHTLRVEIWERGAGYTLSSGTSSCAAAGAAIRTGRCISPVTVTMPGGTMLVEIGDDWSARLTGTVEFVCDGTLAAGSW